MGNHSLKTVIESTVHHILRHQRADGAFSFCCEVNPLPDALMVVFLHLVDSADDPLIPHLCRRLRRHHDADGAWRGYPGQDENGSLTTLCYFSLLLSGDARDARHMVRARQYILRHGGLENVSNLVKIVLACAGQLEWSMLPSEHITLMTWDEFPIVNLYDFASFARLHLLPYLILRHLAFAHKLPPEKSLWNLSTHGCHTTAATHEHIVVNDAAVAKCVRLILERMEPNGTLASYLTATMLAVFALQAVGYDNGHPTIQKAVAGLRNMVYTRHAVPHQQLFTSTIWDTALSMQALTLARLPEAKPALDGAADLLLSRQQHQLSDWSKRAKGLRPGGWGFSDVNTLYPDVDDSVAALQALYPYRNNHTDAWHRGVNWVLGMQNRDGGWSAFDRNNDKAWLEHLPINDVGRAMTDPSTPDLTGRVLHTLCSTGVGSKRAIERGVRWLRHRQRGDGSWLGRWGIAYIYGTFTALRGLKAAGLPANDPVMQRAAAWLTRIQQSDGGFGESCAGDREGKYVSLGASTASQTAWGLMGFMAAGARRTDGVERAAFYLIHTVRPNGGWKERYPTGAGVAGLCYLRYHSYPHVWPLMALCEYRDKY